MIIVMTHRQVLSGRLLLAGVQYDLSDAEAQALIIAGVAVGIKPADTREKAVKSKYETR